MNRRSPEKSEVPWCGGGQGRPGDVFARPEPEAVRRTGRMKAAGVRGPGPGGGVAE